MALIALIIVSEEHLLSLLEFPVFVGCLGYKLPAIEGLDPCYPAPEVVQPHLVPNVVESEGIDPVLGTLGKFENHC